MRPGQAGQGRARVRGAKPALFRAAALVLALVLTSCAQQAQAPAAQAAPPLQDAKTFACYYGPFTEALANYDIAILDAESCTPAQVEQLAENGTRTFAYLSVGEADTLARGDGNGPGGWASYYINENGAPAQNADWGSYFADAGNPAWQAQTLARADELLSMGFTGLFLDTIDTAERYLETFPGICALLAALREAYPNAPLIGNCGMCARAEYLPALSAVMLEDFSSTYNFAAEEYIVLSGDALAYTAVQADALNALLAEHPVPVLALDYCAPGDTARIKQFARRAAEYGFLSCTSNIGLDALYPSPA